MQYFRRTIYPHAPGSRTCGQTSTKTYASSFTSVISSQVNSLLFLKKTKRGYSWLLAVLKDGRLILHALHESMKLGSLRGKYQGYQSGTDPFKLCQTSRQPPVEFDTLSDQFGLALGRVPDRPMRDFLRQVVHNSRACAILTSPSLIYL